MNKLFHRTQTHHDRRPFLHAALFAFSCCVVNTAGTTAWAQLSNHVPVEVSQAIGDALQDGSSRRTDEPAPLNLYGPVRDNQEPTPAAPRQTAVDSESDDFAALLDAPTTSPATQGTAGASTSPSPSSPSPLSSASAPTWTSAPVAANRALPTASSLPGTGNYEFISSTPSEGPLSRFNTYVDGCASADTVGPISPRCIQGFHCVGGACDGPSPGLNAWKQAGPIPWQAFAQGDYVGAARTAQIPEYRLRADDLIEFVFRITGQATVDHYRVQVGDVLRIESLGAPEQNRDEIVVQPDGFISVAIVGEVRAAGRTLAEMSDELEQRYVKDIKNPRVTVSAVKVNTVMEELRNTVDNRYGVGGQSRRSRVTPAGTVQLPAIGSIPAQGLTLTELKREIEAAYASIVTGMEVTPILEQRAPRYIYVLGEVRTPGRFELQGPTTAIQAVALAEGWNPGANLRQVIVFRRDDNWNLMAAQVDIHDALYAKDPCPAGEVWLRDSDIVLVPKRPIKVIDDVIELVFTRGVYGVFPVFFTDTLTTL